MRKFTIVIPTRERSATLKYTLKTCVSQDYDNLTIIVSDNFSRDRTKDIVQSFHDNRIKYVNTGKRLSMTDNWEFALRHVNDSYVTYLGDDDGLLPCAIEYISKRLTNCYFPAFVWKKAEYVWPDDHSDGVLVIPFENDNYEYFSEKVLKRSLTVVNGKLWFPYIRLPVIYNAFVDSKILNAIKQDSGRFFWGVSPDVYSGFAILSKINTYVYSLFPFSVNGASRFSQGRSFVLTGEKSPIVRQFISENENSEGMSLGKICVRGESISNVLEAAYYANMYSYKHELNINMNKFTRAIFKEIAKSESNVYERSTKEFVDICNQKLDLRINLQEIRRRYPNRPVLPSNGFEYGIDQWKCLRVNPRKLEIDDVAKACRFVSKLIGPYEDNKRTHRYSEFGRIGGLAYRLVDRLITDKLL